jgi:glycosyltransferase involved in cell wall biosynthesis
MLQIPLKDPSRYWLGFDRAALRQLMQETTPDIVHVLDEATSRSLFQVAWEHLTTCRNAKILFYGFDNLPLKLRLHSRIKWRSTWSHLAGGVAASTESLDHLRDAGFPSDRPLERVFWGIPTDDFKPMNRELLKAELKLEYPHIVGYVGRFTEEKGIMVLLKAMQRLDRSVHAVFVGSGPIAGKLKRDVLPSSIAKRVHVYDVLPPAQLACLMNCFDVLALPSLTRSTWKEQYGRVIGEAMACGLPVVGSDSGAIPEVIGNAGLVVKEGDAGALAGAIERLVKNRDEAAQLRSRAIERANTELSTKVMAERLHRFYQKVLET